MKLRTSCFNGAVFRKNMTRFAPVGVMYTLCLIAGLVIIIGDEPFPYWIADGMNRSVQYMSAVNLVYAPLLALLFFGDLYNSRMCNGLHAMPLRRQELFGANALSALVYSLVPTAVMALISLPMLSRTIVESGWQISVYWWIAVNLQFVCCFGIAVLCLFCAGNWYAMLALYAGCHSGAYLVFALVESFYTPMLTGVQTSEYLATLLTPMNWLIKQPLDLDDWFLLRYRFRGNEDAIVATFSLNGPVWKGYVIWAAVGLACLVVGWLLYRRRDLEAAGDPIAVKPLVPVVQVAATSAAAIIAAVVFREILGVNQQYLAYVMLFVATIVAWAAVKMVLSRTSRVFRVKNFLGLIPVLGVLAVTMLATRMDVLHIADWVPETDDVRSASVYVGNNTLVLTEKEDIETLRRLHKLAMEEGIPYNGGYDRDLLDTGLSLQEVYDITGTSNYTDEQLYVTRQLRRAVSLYINYDLGNGRYASRYYAIWQDGTTGELVRSLCDDWDTYWEQCAYGAYWQEIPLEPEELTSISVDGYNHSRSMDISQEEVASLVEALKADCAQGSMCRLEDVHNGVFYRESTDLDGNPTDVYDRAMYIQLFGEDGTYTRGTYLDVYPDCTNTIAWLQERGYMIYEVIGTN